MAFTSDKREWIDKNPYQGYSSELSNMNSGLYDINHTLKPIDRDKSNAEIEKNELVFMEDGSILKALGKRHSQGGTPVNLPQGSFIFSDYKPLAISKADKEEFKFKQNGKHKAKNSTPAKVLEKEVDLKHHNRMVATIKDDTKDSISRKSAELMLQKNLAKAGQVAYLQEEYKGFPEGLPEFSKGTAPVTDQNIENEQTMQKQFQFGGMNNKFKKNTFNFYQNPYQNSDLVDMSQPNAFNSRGFINEKQDNRMYKDVNNGGLFNTNHQSVDMFGNPYMQVGGNVWGGDRYGNRRRGTLTSNATKYSQKEWDDFAKELGYTGNKGIKGFQNVLHSDPRFTSIIDGLHQQYKPGPNQGMFDGKIGYRWDAIMKAHKDNQVPKITPLAGIVPNLDPGPPPLINPLTQSTIPQNPSTPKVEATTQPNAPINPYTQDIQLTPSQKLDVGTSLYNAASINKYAPKRSQVSFMPVNLEKINAQPYINAVNSQTQQGYRANQVMNPILARLQNSQIQGRGNAAVNQAIGSVDERNSAISNQENLYNNQGINTANNQNIQLDQNYYNEVQKLNQNYDDETRFARNQISDKYLKHMGDNQALAMGIMAQPMGTKDVYNPKTGKMEKQASPINDFNFRTGNPYYTGAAMSLDQMQSEVDMTDAKIEKYIRLGMTPAEAIKAANYNYRTAVTGQKQRRG